jgi:hypothetical protein
MVFPLRAAGAFILAIATLSPVTPAQSVTPLVLPRPPQPLLPTSFAGWTATVPPQTGTTPDTADQANADILREYGLKDYAIADYTRGANRLTLRARRFIDATGAYGAFTFYRRPGMRAEDIGKGAASEGSEVLFWTGTSLIDAVFAKGSVDKAALKAAAAAIPQTFSSEGIPPSLPQHLPAQSLDASSVRYSIGPLAYARTGGVLPPALIDFSRDAEAVTAQYTTRDGKGTLTLLEYPTPQIAIARAKAIDAQLKQGAIAGGSAVAQGVHRSGPLVAVTSGNFSSSEAQALLAAVKYEAEVTVNHPEGYVSEVKKTARLLLGILYLTGILGGASIVVGLFLGGGRALMRRLRGKPVSTLNDEQFITLKLSR